MPGRPTRILLASASPRRRDLLAALRLEVEITPSGIDEDRILADSPRALALKRAFAKAGDIADRAEEGDIVIAADTVVALGDRDFGKPADADEARAMLGALRGETHSVITGVAIAEARGSVEVDACETGVTFRDFAEEDLEIYLRTGEWEGKAGAYGIQGEARTLIERWNGCWCNVVGQPLALTLQLLGDRIDAVHHPLPCDCTDWPHRAEGDPLWKRGSLSP